MSIDYKLTETYENYLEAIYNMRDEASATGQKIINARLADRLGLKPPTVSQTLQRMSIWKNPGVVQVDMGGDHIVHVRGIEPDPGDRPEQVGDGTGRPGVGEGQSVAGADHVAGREAAAIKTGIDAIDPVCDLFDGMGWHGMLR